MYLCGRVRLTLTERELLISTVSERDFMLVGHMLDMLSGSKVCFFVLFFPLPFFYYYYNNYNYSLLCLFYYNKSINKIYQFSFSMETMRPNCGTTWKRWIFTFFPSISLGV